MKGKLILAALALSGFGCTSATFSAKDISTGAYESTPGTAKIKVAQSFQRAASAPAVADKVEEVSPERELSYQAEAEVVTDDIGATSEAIRKKCKNLGGYLFSMGSSKLNLRVPSKYLESFIAELGDYGQLKSSSIRAEDVTDKHFDLRVRINNAEQLRLRLLALSAKSKNVEEALRMEREIARVTENLERMKGMLNKSTDRVEYSMLVIYLSSPQPVKKPVFRVPFVWVNNLAGSLKKPYTPKPRKGGWFSTKISAEQPEGFASFYNYENTYWAMNGRGGYYRIQRVENDVPDGDLKFWQQTVVKYLKEGRLMTVEKSEEIESKSGKGFQIRASYGSGKYKMFYLLQVVPGEDNILVSEIWGEEADFIENKEQIKVALKNVKSSL